HGSFDSVAGLRDLLAERIERQTFKGYQDVFSINWVDGEPYFFLNGYVSIPIAGSTEQLYGVLAAMMAPRTDRVLVLGQGFGGTAGTLALIFARVDCVEINPLVAQNLFRMAPWNFGLHERKNFHVVVDDGMHVLKRSGDRYSLIVN